MGRGEIPTHRSGMVTTGLREIRVFVASPNDVSFERAGVERVVAKLNAEFAGVAVFRAIRWEAAFYKAHSTFQAQIPEAAECDVVIVVFGNKLGTELPEEFEPRLPGGEPYPSGTAYELLSSLAAADECHRAGAAEADLRPAVYVFRRTTEPQFKPSQRAEFMAALREQDRLSEFFQRWFFTPSGAFRRSLQKFSDPIQFEDQVDALLRQWAKQSLRLLPSWDIARDGLPFRGLEPFDARHSRVFFGRDRKVRRAIEELLLAGGRERGRPFLLIVGPSGAGKSSLVRAGVIPRLTASGVVAGVDLWRVAVMRPGGGANAFAALAAALYVSAAPESDQGGFGAALPELAAGPFRTPEQLAEVLESAVPAATAPVVAALEAIGAAARPTDETARPLRADLVLLVDQLEEIFVTSVADLERIAFARLLMLLADTGRVWIIATLRADLYAHMLDQKSPFLWLKDSGRSYDLASPGEAELREILEKSAQAADLVYDKDAATGESLDELLLRDATGADALPLLQFSLKELFERRGPVPTGDGPRTGLTFAAYRDFGGLDGAIDKVAEAAVHDHETGSVRADYERALPRLLRSLAERIQDEHGTTAAQAALTARSVPLASAARDDASLDLINALVRARLLVSAANASHEASVRLAHERVLASWQRALRIVQAHRAFFDVMADLRTEHQRWINGRKGRDFLLSGQPLQRAEETVREYGDEMPAGVREYVAASGRRARVLRRATASVISVFVAVLVVTAALGLLAARAEQKAASNYSAAKTAADQLVASVTDELSMQKDVRSETLDTIYRVTASLFDGIETSSQRQDGPITRRLQAAFAAVETLIPAATRPPDEASALARSRSNLLYEFALIYHRSASDQKARAMDETALGMVRQSLAIRQRLLDAGDTAPQSRADVASAQMLLGDITRRGIENAPVPGGTGGSPDFSPVRSLLDPALHTFERLDAQFPGRPEWERGLSRVLTRLGDLDLKAHRFDAASGDDDRAAAISLKVFRAAPGDAGATLELAWTYRKVGDLMMQEGTYDAAATAYARDACIRRRLATRYTTNADFSSDLGWSLAKLGDARMASQPPDLPGARDAYYEALAERLDLVLANPSKPALFKDYADSLAMIGAMHRKARNAGLADIFGAAADDVRRQIPEAFRDTASPSPDQAAQTTIAFAARMLRENGPLPMISQTRRQAIEDIQDDFKANREPELRHQAEGCWEKLVGIVGTASTGNAVAP